MGLGRWDYSHKAIDAIPDSLVRTFNGRKLRVNRGSTSETQTVREKSF